MSKVKIAGHASGSGTLTIQAPDTSSSRTITLPDATGTLLNSDGDGSSLTGIAGNTPCFQATNSADQTGLADNTWTKVEFDTEAFSIGGTYDDTTNYRWTPGVAGKYYIAFHVSGLSTDTSAHKETLWIIYKNGVAVDETKGYLNQMVNYGMGGNLTAHAIIDLDADDYVEAYAKNNTNATTWNITGDTGAFWGYRLIGT